MKTSKLRYPGLLGLVGPAGVVFALQVLAFTVSLVVYERGGKDE